MVTQRTAKEREKRAVLREHARQMRHEPTPAEKVLWSMLRDRRLNGYKFRRQFPIGGFIADFVCVEKKLVVELDGVGHDERAAYDTRRDNLLVDEGFRIVRFWNADFLADQDGTVKYIAHLLESGEAPSPRPSPPKRGEGVT